MGKKEKLLERFKSRPKDFTWSEFVRLMGYLDFREIKTKGTSGSRRKFVNSDGVIISLHEPHPRPVLKGYAIKQVLVLLMEEGLI